MSQQHHVRGLDGGIGSADAYGHPVGSVMKVNGFTSSVDLRQRRGRGVFLIRSVASTTSLTQTV